jgi:hypothetical protein
MADDKQNQPNMNDDQNREQMEREKGQSGQFKDDKSGERDKSAIGGGQGGQSGQQPTGQSDREREDSRGGSDNR